MYTIRGVKQVYVHRVNLHAARDILQQAFNDAQLVPNAHVWEQWWVDIGIEVSSPEDLCPQWVTACHNVLASIGLGISVQATFNATHISDEVYSLPFIITPSPFLAFQMTFRERHLYSCYSY